MYHRARAYAPSSDVASLNSELMFATGSSHDDDTAKGHVLRARLVLPAASGVASININSLREATGLPGMKYGLIFYLALDWDNVVSGK